MTLLHIFDIIDLWHGCSYSCDVIVNLLHDWSYDMTSYGCRVVSWL